MSIRKVNLPMKAVPLTQRQVQERYFTRTIETHPKYRLIISSIKEGIKATEVAAHFAANGWLHVSERVFTDALRFYINKYSDIIDNHAIEGLDKHVDPNQPQVDLRSQLQQLLRLQRARIGHGYQLEKTGGFLSAQLPKEIEQARLLVETIGKLDGKIGDTGRGIMHGEDHSVLENLSKVKREQITRDRLHSAVKQLVEVKVG